MKSRSTEEWLPCEVTTRTVLSWGPQISSSSPLELLRSCPASPEIASRNLLQLIGFEFSHSSPWKGPVFFFSLPELRLVLIAPTPPPNYHRSGREFHSQRPVAFQLYIHPFPPMSRMIKTIYMCVGQSDSQPHGTELISYRLAGLSCSCSSFSRCIHPAPLSLCLIIPIFHFLLHWYPINNTPSFHGTSTRCHQEPIMLIKMSLFNVDRIDFPECQSPYQITPEILPFI